MTVIRTKTPAGEPIVIMPEAEFERLRELAEDAEDLATMARVEAALAAGTEELLTTEEVDALLNATSPLSFWREKRGLSIEQLAESAGVDTADIAASERGEEVSNIHFYERVARPLGLDIEDILPRQERGAADR